MTTFSDFFAEPMVVALGWALLHSIWQGTALTLGAALLLRLTRFRPAAVRYTIAMGAMALQMLLFLGTMAVCHSPGRSLTMMPDGRRVALVWQAAETGMASSATSWLSGLNHFFNQYLPLVVGFWILGAGMLLVRLIGGWMMVQRLTRQGVRPAPEAWSTYLKQLAADLGVSKTVRLIESAEIPVPMTIGWLKPVVLLPVGLLTGLSPRQLEAVLAHELAHIYRYDYLINILQSVVEVVFFFHPATWWLSARVREEREHCCDDVAIRLCGDRTSLAQALVHIEERRQASLSAPVLAMAFGARRQSLLQRVKRVIGIAEEKPALNSNGIAVAVCLLLFAGLVVGQQVRKPAGSGTRRTDRDTTIQVTEKIEVKTGETYRIETDPNGKKVILTVENDTLDPKVEEQIRVNLERHEMEMERLDRELQKLEVPLSRLDQEMKLQDEAMKRSDQVMRQEVEKMRRIQVEMDRKLQEAATLEMKRGQGKNGLTAAEMKRLRQVEEEIAMNQKRLEQMNEREINGLHEKLRELTEEKLRVLHDSMGAFSERASRIIEESARHLNEVQQLHLQLNRIDTLEMPEPPEAPEPAPAIAPVPPATPRPAKVPKSPKPAPAGVKGAYWYNGKRYDSPADMPRPPKPASPAEPAVVADLPEPAIAPVAPQAPEVPDAPAAPALAPARRSGRAASPGLEPARPTRVKFKSKGTSGKRAGATWKSGPAPAKAATKTSYNFSEKPLPAGRVA
ncbi:M56 family metallopeptidase [Larkinella soli]|uniref:M56 family metallopeptidase n=1 Tax=Larkinella soli TaxID=1770527 RepID=UPI000FFB74FD|nr:M56 family metallopeptidase [Larkinella soli]